MPLEPLFASQDLAARIERAECELIAQGVEAVRRRHPDADVFCIRLAGGVATYAGENSPLNKVAGLGFDGAVDEAALDAVESAYAAKNMPVQVELSTLAEPHAAELLTRRGYVLRGFENVLGLRLSARPRREVAPDIEIASANESDRALWLDAVVEGFMHRDVQGTPSPESFPREILEHAIQDFAYVEGMRQFLARLNGAPAGGASMRLHEGVAQLCGAATRPEHRRRGVQSALLTTRLDIAANEGCDIAVVSTLPGSKSQENVQKQGFELLYARAVLVREPGQPIQ